MSRPLVSILIVTHNAEKYIDATLASCLSQTYESFEILILDNASTDRTVALIEAKQNPRVRIWKELVNIGPYQGLNILLVHAQGHYIAIQDHDDIWLENKLEQQGDFLDNHPEYVACGTLTYYYFEDRRLFVLPHNTLTTDFVDHTSLMFRRSAVAYDPRRALPDEYFIRKTLRRLGRIGCLQAGLTIHRIRNDRKNLSTDRTKWNLRGAWEHLTLTHYRDLPGTLMFVVASWLPVRWLWWIRKNVTLKKARWLSQQEFVSEHNVQL